MPAASDFEYADYVKRFFVLFELLQEHDPACPVTVNGVDHMLWLG